jgi:hypothetical protein
LGLRLVQGRVFGVNYFFRPLHAVDGEPVFVSKFSNGVRHLRRFMKSRFKKILKTTLFVRFQKIEYSFFYILQSVPISKGARIVSGMMVLWFQGPTLAFMSGMTGSERS